MKIQHPKYCAECNGGKYISMSGTLIYKDHPHIGGDFEVPDTYWVLCDKCGGMLFDGNCCEKIEAVERRIIKERLANLPIGDFVSKQEACKLLGIKKFPKKRCRQNTFIWKFTIGDRTMYNKNSIEMFLTSEYGNGLFKL